jgi:hypothetical protein
MNCPVCKRELETIISGSGLYYYCCPSKNDKHIFEIGPYRTMIFLVKAIEVIERKTK